MVEFDYEAAMEELLAWQQEAENNTAIYNVLAGVIDIINDNIVEE